jgi:hypothetical protein
LSAIKCSRYAIHRYHAEPDNPIFVAVDESLLLKNYLYFYESLIPLSACRKPQLYNNIMKK